MDERSIQASGTTLFRAETILESIPDAFLAVDGAWRYSYVNHQAEALLGRSREELLGRNVWEVFPHAATGPGYVNLHRAMETGEAVTYETPFDPLNAWFEVRAYPSNAGLTINLRDVTERKQEDETLRERERHLSFVLEAGGVGSWKLDLASGSLQCSEIFRSNFGLPSGADFSSCEYFRSMIHPEDRDDIQKAVEHAIATGTYYEAEYRIVTPTGELRWISARGSVEYEPDGAPVSLAGVTADITERKRTETALRASEERYRTLFDSLDEGFCVVEMLFDENNAPIDYRFLEINPAFEKQTGLQQAAGKTMRQLAPDHEAYWYEIYGEIAMTGVPARFVNHSQAMNRWFDVFAFRLGGHESRNVAILFKDITEHKRAEETLRETERQLRTLNETLEQRVTERTHDLTHVNRALEQRNQELQDFAYAASHDLQEPLRKVTTFAGLLRADYGEALDDTARRYVQRMEDSASRMSGLLRDLLAFSRVATRGHPFQQTDLGEILADVVADPELDIDETEATVDLEPLPSIEADPGQMRQLFQNLIGNALKFRRSDVPPRIQVRCAPEEAAGAGERVVCRITVEDNGIGFDAKYRERIFSPFQRLHGRSTYPGSGMGLAICRRIVERHGGTITAESTPGEGSRFVVTLPVRQPHQAAQES